MKKRRFRLKNHEELLVREAMPADAAQVLGHVQRIAEDSENLTFTAEEMALTVQEEEEILKRSKESENDVFLLGFIGEELVASLVFSGGKRSRVRHAGEFGMAVLKKKWNLGIGGILMDSLIDWARETKFIRKIHLKVRVDNEPAIHLYAKKGFKREGTLSRGFMVEGEFVDLLCMGYEL